MSNVITKYLAQGAGGAVLFGGAVGFDKGVDLGGMRVPTWALGAAVGAGAAFVTDVLHDYVTPQLSKDERLKHVEGAIFAPAISAAAFIGAMQLVEPRIVAEVGWKSLAAQGAVSELASQWVYENLAKPYLSSDYHEVEAF